MNKGGLFFPIVFGRIFLTCSTERTGGQPILMKIKYVPLGDNWGKRRIIQYINSGVFNGGNFKFDISFCCIYRKNPPKSAAAAFWRHQIHWIIEAYIYFFTYHDYGLLNYFLPFKKDEFLHNTLILGYFTLRKELKSHH